MKLKYSIKIPLTLVLCLIMFLHVNAQVTVERSKDKMIISGTVYYIHTVKKGETSFSISRAYGVKVEELMKENPPAVYGLNEGQILRLPVREPESTPPEPQSVSIPRDENRFIYHKLQPGETVYSLSRLYGVSENEIISVNPGIDITKLPVNSEVTVPRRQFMTGRHEFNVQDPDYISHKVEKGESLSSIAEKYGLTLRELRRVNRNLRFPQVGDYVRIPVALADKLILPEIPSADTVIIAPEEQVVMLERPSEYTPVSDLKGSFNIAVLLPFYLKENSIRREVDSSRIVKGKRIYRTLNKQDDWIYPRSLTFLEMYEGILLAADTLRSLGLDIKLHVYDIKSDTNELVRLIKQGRLERMDLIVGPVYSSNLAIVTAYAGDLGIPVVSPVQLINNAGLMNNPTLFMPNPSLEVAQNAIAARINDFPANNFVFIHSDLSGSDPEVKYFKEKIISSLSSSVPYEDIRFKELVFYSRSVFGNDSINRLGHALSSVTDNVIIIASEEGPVLSEILQEIHGLSKKFPLQVFCYPSIQALDNLEPKFIFDLNILLFSPYWIDYSRQDVIHFNSDFRKKFLIEPSEMSYAWIGYDIFYYFLSGIAIHGTNFILHPEIHNPDLLQTEFFFRRKRPSDGFENQYLFPVRYTRDYEVKLEPAQANGQ